jgi:hypothetical protein
MASEAVGGGSIPPGTTFCVARIESRVESQFLGAEWVGKSPPFAARWQLLSIKTQTMSKVRVGRRSGAQCGRGRVPRGTSEAA